MSLTGTHSNFTMKPELVSCELIKLDLID